MYNTNAQQNQPIRPTQNNSVTPLQPNTNLNNQYMPNNQNNLNNQHVNADPQRSSWWGNEHNNDVSWGKTWGPYANHDAYDSGNYNYGQQAYEPYPDNNAYREQAYSY